MSSDNTGSGGRKGRFPAVEDGDEAAVDFCNHHFAEQNTYRLRHMQRIVRDIHYDNGRQWIELDTQLASAEGGRGYMFREMQQSVETEMPRPVTNHIAPAIDVEFATLSKRQWSPKIPTYSRDPRMEAAAKVAQNILEDRLKKLKWDDFRDRFIRNVIAHGTGIIKSYWDESYYETSWVSVPAPQTCQDCHAMLASNTVPAGWSKGDNFDDFKDVDEQVSISTCPACGSSNLVPLDEIDEDTSHGMDVLGRPLGQKVPKGNTNIEVLTPFEYYPQNAGVFHNTSTVKMHGVCKVRSLDWVEEHYPEVIDEIEPEDPSDLLKDHPFLGEWDYIGRFDSGLDSGVLDQHIRVYEMYQEPTYRFPKGRAVVILGKQQRKVVENGDLIREVTDADGSVASVPKVVFASAVWKQREGEFWGRSIVDDLVSPQNRVNGIDAQVIEARERMGSPNLIVPEDADLQGPELRAGYGSGKLFTYNLSALNPNAKPEVFGSILMPSGVYQERQAMLQDMTRIIGPADIEIGEAPRNVTTTSGLQILGEQAERRRGTREREITSAIQKVWEHQLQLIWVLRVDMDEYEYKTPDGLWELKQYSREHIKGQTKVIVEKQAYIDRSIVMREAAREAMVDGLYTLDSPLARKKLLELRGLPTDVNEDTTLQIDHAKRVWADFVDEGRVPVIDTSIDNPSIRFQVLGTMLLQDEGTRLSDMYLWPDILPKIAGWEQELMVMEAQDEKTRATYGGIEPDPQTANETYQNLMAIYQEAKAAYDMQMATRQPQQLPDGTIGNPPALNPPPEPPPPPVFLPRQFEVRIYLVWQQMIAKHNGLAAEIQKAASKRMVDPLKLAGEIDKFLKFRAVVEAYRLLGQPAVAPGSTPGAPMAPPAAPPPEGAGGPQQPPAPQTPPQPPGGNPLNQGR